MNFEDDDYDSDGSGWALVLVGAILGIMATCAYLLWKLSA